MPTPPSQGCWRCLSAATRKEISRAPVCRGGPCARKRAVCHHSGAAVVLHPSPPPHQPREPAWTLPSISFQPPVHGRAARKSRNTPRKRARLDFVLSTGSLPPPPIPACRSPCKLRSLLVLGFAGCLPAFPSSHGMWSLPLSSQMLISIFTQIPLTSWHF